MRKYDIIYVDPPWEYKQPGSKKNSRGMAKQKYNTISRSGINNCLPSAMGMGGGHTPMVESNLTIRKLRPKECFRLQGFLNDEVNLEGLSNTQQYKLVGNGQSVNVVEKIFKNMFKESTQ